MDNFTTFDELGDLVNKNDGVVTVYMEQLRDAHGVARLGKFVIDAISAELSKKGLAHIPSELPSYQHEGVRIYRNGTSLSKVINALFDVKDKDHHVENDKNDAFVRETLQNSNKDVIDRIRELVCE